jgi:spore coat protein U-like protein
MSSNKNTSRLGCAAVALMIAASSAPVIAATATASLTISANVLSTCSLTGGSIPFGTYSAVAVDQTGTLSVLCTNGVPYTIALDAGTGTSATTTNRKMTGSVSGTLNYTLYRETGRTTNWGNTVGTDTVPGTGSGVSQTVTVYGRIPAAQTPLVGSYADTVTVTLAY